MRTLLLYALVLPLLFVLLASSVLAVSNPRQWHGNKVVQIRETTPQKTAPAKPVVSPGQKVNSSNTKPTSARRNKAYRKYKVRYTSSVKNRSGRGPSEQAFPHRFSTVGAISSVDRNARTLKVLTMGGREYVVDASKAEIQMEGRSSNLSNLDVGDSVRVRGSLDGNRLTATTIIEVTAGYVGQDTTVVGRFTGLSQDKRTLTMSRGGRNVSIHIPVSAEVIMYGQEISYETIPEGSNIKVKGRWTGSSVVEASVVEVFPPR